MGCIIGYTAGQVMCMLLEENRDALEGLLCSGNVRVTTRPIRNREANLRAENAIPTIVEPRLGGGLLWGLEFGGASIVMLGG